MALQETKGSEWIVIGFMNRMQVLHEVTLGPLLQAKDIGEVLVSEALTNELRVVFL